MSPPGRADSKRVRDHDRVHEEILHGGVANAGAVVRVGNHVLRPSNEFSTQIHAALSALRAAGFAGASKPVGIDDDGRERLEYVEGDVPIPPYPDWARSDDALASVARLIRRLHDASTRIRVVPSGWNDEMADPRGGPVLCHNDVCLENVVFVDGEAIALLDFDFAAPGRPAFDVASFARMCVPIDDEINAGRLGWLPADTPARLRLVCDAYGMGAGERSDVLRFLAASIERGGEFVRRRVEAGDRGFVKMWEDMGGQERFDRRRRWWSDHAPAFGRALA